MREGGAAAIEVEMEDSESAVILGQKVAVTTYRKTYEQIVSWALAADRAYLIEAANTHVVTLGRHDAELRTSWMKNWMISR